MKQPGAKIFLASFSGDLRQQGLHGEPWCAGSLFLDEQPTCVYSFLGEVLLQLRPVILFHEDYLGYPKGSREKNDWIIHRNYTAVYNVYIFSAKRQNKS